jgi:hypothetical protein
MEKDPIEENPGNTKHKPIKIFHKFAFTTIFYLLLFNFVTLMPWKLISWNRRDENGEGPAWASFTCLILSTCLIRFFFMFLGEVLELKNVTREMSGEYVCSADNGIGLGPVSRSISINVLCK